MPLASMQAVGRLSPAVWYPGYASRLSLPIDTPLRNAPLRPRRRRWRLAQADAEALIRDYGPEDVGWAARGRARNARDRQRAAHWRRVARAVARMMAKMID